MLIVRSKIFGILGLAPRGIANKIPLNCTLSLEELYKRTFIAHLELVHRLEMLSAYHLQNRLADMPSWVPNFGLASPLHRSDIRSTASGFSRAQFIYQPPNTLVVTGLRCARIREFARSFSTKYEIFTLLRKIGLDSLYDESYVTGESLLEAYAWVIAVGELKERSNDARVSMQCLKENLTNGVNLANWEDIDLLTMLLTYIQEYSLMLIVTEEGYIGMGPKYTAPGKYHKVQRATLFILEMNEGRLTLACR